MTAQLKEKFSVVSHNAYRSSGICGQLADKGIPPEWRNWVQDLTDETNKTNSMIRCGYLAGALTVSEGDKVHSRLDAVHGFCNDTYVHWGFVFITDLTFCCCIYIYTHTHTYIYIHTHTHTYVHTYVHTTTTTHTYTHTYIYTLCDHTFVGICRLTRSKYNTFISVRVTFLRNSVGALED